MKREVKLTLVTLLASVVFSGTAFANSLPPRPVHILTLKDAVLLAVRNNAQVEQAEIQRISDKFGLTVAEKQFQPKYTLTASNSFTNTTTNGHASYGETWGVSPKVSLENHYGTAFSLTSTNPMDNGTFNPSLVFKVIQPLIRGFGRPVVEAALNDAFDTQLINKLTFKQAIITAVQQVVNSYLSLVNATQGLVVDRKSLADYKRTVANDRAMIAAGRMAKTEIVQAKAQVATQESTIQSDINSINTGKNTLLDNLGLPPNTSITLPKVFDFKKLMHEVTNGVPLPTPKLAQKTALAQNTTYQGAVIAIRNLRRNVMTAKDGRRWSLNLTASETVGGGSGGGQNAGFKSLTNGRDHVESAGLDLAIPIDDVAQQSTLISDKVILDKAIIGLRETKRTLIEQVESDFDSVTNARKTLALGISALKLQQQTVYISEQKQLAGQVSTFQVLSDQKDLASQEESVVDDQVGYLKSVVSLQTELGTALDPWGIKLRY